MIRLQTRGRISGNVDDACYGRQLKREEIVKGKNRESNNNNIGIISYGAYIPLYRLSYKQIAEEWGQVPRNGEKAIANWDEDSLTMGVEAALDCLSGTKEPNIDAVFFASTTPPYREKQAASILARVVEAEEEAFTVDFTDSLRAGTSAIIAAINFINSNGQKDNKTFDYLLPERWNTKYYQSAV